MYKALHFTVYYRCTRGHGRSINTSDVRGCMESTQVAARHSVGKYAVDIMSPRGLKELIVVMMGKWSDDSTC